MLVFGKTLKILNNYSIHIFARNQSGSHDNKYVKIIKNGTILAKYLLVEERWEFLSKDIPKVVIKWVTTNSENILNKISKLG